MSARHDALTEARELCRRWQSVWGAKARGTPGREQAGAFNAMAGAAGALAGLIDDLMEEGPDARHDDVPGPSVSVSREVLPASSPAE